MANVIFKTGTRAQYDALPVKYDNTLYWLNDTQELYKGTLLFGCGKGGGGGGGSLPSGGKAGQVLMKKSDASGDADWGDVPAGALEGELRVSSAVGGATSGKKYDAGTSLEAVLRDMLNPVLNPTFIAPSATLRSNAARTIYGIDEPVGNVTFTLTFDRGAISTGGSRAGEATAYVIDGRTGSTVAIDMDARFGAAEAVTMRGTVQHSQGDQPKNSAGEDWGEPLGAGSVNSNTIVFTKKPYIYTTKSGVFARMSIAEYNASPLEIELENGDGVTKPVATVALPDKAKSIQTYNIFTSAWDDCSAEFTETAITLDGRAYYKYEDSRGYASGDRPLKFTW